MLKSLLEEVPIHERLEIQNAGFGWERKVFTMYEMQAESPFTCDYVKSRNAYYKRVMTSTAESKGVLTKNADERTMKFLLFVDLAYIYFISFFFFSLILSPVAKSAWLGQEWQYRLLFDGWCGQSIVRAFTRFMMKKIPLFSTLYDSKYVVVTLPISP